MMTAEDFKAYLDKVVEKAFHEGALYERNKAKLGDNIISMETAIENAKVNILGE